jgi:hypothetical protein
VGKITEMKGEAPAKVGDRDSEYSISIVSDDPKVISQRVVIKTTWLQKPSLKVFADDKLVAVVRDGDMMQMQKSEFGESELVIMLLARLVMISMICES